MSRVKFTAQMEKDMFAFYTEEKIRLEAKLSHVNKVLSKFNSGAVSIETSTTTKAVASKPASKSSEKKKRRGPKSKWGKFIVNRLRARQKPMSYEELIDDAISINKMPADKHAAARASILNSAFRLRTVHGKIVTVGRSGRKEKLIVLTKWLDEEGNLQQPYAKQFKQIKKGKAEQVDMSAIPSSDLEL